MGTWIFRVLALSLVMTIVLEEGFGRILGIRDRWNMALIALVNILTNPAVVYIYYLNLLYMGRNPAAVTALAETAAVICEGLCYRAASRGIRHPWLFSAGANLCSYGAGVLIMTLVRR